MKLQFHIELKKYVVDTEKAVDLSIPLRFNGLQPKFFDVPNATAHTFEGGGFIGDTKRGGSCNVKEFRLNPHCHGTHTESIGHVVDQDFPISEIMKTPSIPATLITVTPRKNADGDEVIDRTSLEETLKPWKTSGALKALIIRTLPNDDSKTIRHYGDIHRPAFLSTEAMNYISELAVEHLLVDLPSLDKMHDEGKLAAHRIFWGLPEDSRDLKKAKFPKRTVTEMIYAPSSVTDGLYLLNLQMPHFMSDVSPCRPVICPMEATT